MPRFSSQRVRQVQLKMGTVLDSNLLPETLELFDQRGNPINVDASPFPPGGQTGQALTKRTDADSDIQWGDLAGSGSAIPLGGRSGQVLTKRTDADSDIQWADLASSATAVPLGGLSGQVLAKRSDTDNDVEWVDLPTEVAPGTMVWKGAWVPNVAYSQGDVVMYDDGGGSHAYVFTEDVADTGGDPLLPQFDGQTITKFYDPDAASPIELVIDANSPRTETRIAGDPSPYDLVAFKAVTAGTIDIETRPIDNVQRDMWASWWALAPNGQSWQYNRFNDDSAGFGHPAILAAGFPANIYLLLFTTYNPGSTAAVQYGTSVVEIGTSNEVTFEAFNFGEPGEFPTSSVMQIG